MKKSIFDETREQIARIQHGIKDAQAISRKVDALLVTVRKQISDFSLAVAEHNRQINDRP